MIMYDILMRPELSIPGRRVIRPKRLGVNRPWGRLKSEKKEVNPDSSLVKERARTQVGEKNGQA